jgi:hypothetical protein
VVEDIKQNDTATMCSDDSDSEEDDYRQRNRYTDDSFSDSRKVKSVHKRQNDRRAENLIIKAAAEKRIRDLEDRLIEMEETNRKLKAQLQAAKKITSRGSTKIAIRNDNAWTCDEGNLADKVTSFCREYLFPRYKFLKDGWMDYEPENERSFCFFVGQKMSLIYPNMRIRTIGNQFESEWNRVYVPTISLKYTHMRCNLGNDIRSQYFGKQVTTDK